MPNYNDEGRATDRWTDRVNRRSVVRAGFAVALSSGLAGCSSDFGPDPTAEDTETSTKTETSVEAETPPTESETEALFFYDDWSDGEFSDWEVVDAGGDGMAEIDTIEAPEGGPSVLSLSQSTGSGTEFIIATGPSFEGWHNEWTVRTNIHTTELDPQEDYQTYEILPAFDETLEEDTPLRFRVGIRDGNGNLRSAHFSGEAYTNSQTYEVDWTEDRWYNIEFGHDGDGTFTGTVWPADSARPMDPNVEATGPVPSTEARPLGLNIDGPGSPNFRMSHAYIELTGALTER